MAGFSSGKPGTAITGINVTPLVDVTLVLLVIFLVTAKLVVSRAMPMDLPKAATGGEVQRIFSVSVRADGVTLVDGVATPSDRDFLERARAALASDPGVRAVIQADGTVEHRRVMHVLDVLRQAGLSRVAFGVQQGSPVDAETSP
ncbi:MAG TPA: biopolymer transporter ExbD [Polyangiaceae bacterium]|nr:biopolymer transporter ExbD [Polyangiaceae bacterium]